MKGRRGALVVTNVAADPMGHGHGTSLMAAIATFADGLGRDLVLIVNPANDAAIHLYRSCGFVVDKNIKQQRTRMIRAADVGAVPTGPPSWLVPIHVGISSAVASTLGLAALITLYWGTPVVWLMAPVVVLAALAAENDVSHAAHPQSSRRCRGVRHGVDPCDRRRCHGRTAGVAGNGRGGVVRRPVVRQPRSRSRSKRPW